MKKLSAVVFTIMVCALFSISVNAQFSAIDANIEAKKREKFSELITEAARSGKVRVIVGLRTEIQMQGGLQQEERARQLFKIKEDQANFLNRHESLRLEKIKQFQFIPFLAFEATGAALEQIQNDSAILTVEEDELSEPTLAESTPIVGANAAWSSGFSGSGQTVAILDTGVDKTHPFLSGRVVSEACYSSNYETTITSVCPNGVIESVEANSGMNCDNTISSCAHGTHVAGIAAGRGNSFSGVAKDANIIAIQVFSKINNAQDCGSNPTPCVLSYVSDQIKGLERVIALSGTMNIAAVNMSLGGGQYSSNCDAQQPSRKAVIDNLRSLGIATVISSGNSGYTAAIGAPACISSAVSVGSTDDGSFSTVLDSVSSFSNSASFLTLLAPGRWIGSSVPNGSYSYYSGTSMAAPHVAGAFAVLKQRKPTANVQELLNALTSTGQPITDSRNNVTKPRIRVDLALNALSSNRKSQFDYDGDGKSDASIFRPANGEWWFLRSSDNQNRAFQFGNGTDKITPADYTGDGKTDIAFWRESTGTWYVLRSEDSSFYSFPFGTSGDIPVSADYDGDGKADAAVYRPTNQHWYIMRSSGGTTIQQFGSYLDAPVAADYDGDSKADIAVFRPSNGEWWIQRSSNSTVTALQFGTGADKAVPADYTGDGKADVAFWRVATGEWFVLRSENLTYYSAPFGTAGDAPVAADYDGDGKADFAVFRAGSWYLQRSSAGFTVQPFGNANDTPTPFAFVR